MNKTEIHTDKEKREKVNRKRDAPSKWETKKMKNEK